MRISDWSSDVCSSDLSACRQLWRHCDRIPASRHGRAAACDGAGLAASADLHSLCRAHRTPSLVTLAAAAPCGTRRTLRIIGAARGFGALVVLSIRSLLVCVRACVCAHPTLSLFLVAAPRCGWG